MITSIAILSVIGFLLSLYGFFIERKIEQDSNYKPLCDLSDAISCSKPIVSEYGNIFIISNTVIGIFFYTLLLMLAYIESTTLIFYVSLAACLASLVLAYILFAKIKTLCLLCTGIYLVNIGLLVASYKAM